MALKEIRHLCGGLFHQLVLLLMGKLNLSVWRQSISGCYWLRKGRLLSINIFSPLKECFMFSDIFQVNSIAFKRFYWGEGRIQRENLKTFLKGTLTYCQQVLYSITPASNVKYKTWNNVGGLEVIRVCVKIQTLSGNKHNVVRPDTGGN